jgi:hypothetical protein
MSTKIFDYGITKSAAVYRATTVGRSLYQYSTTDTTLTSTLSAVSVNVEVCAAGPWQTSTSLH